MSHPFIYDCHSAKVETQKSQGTEVPVTGRPRPVRDLFFVEADSAHSAIICATIELHRDRKDSLKHFLKIPGVCSFIPLFLYSTDCLADCVVGHVLNILLMPSED